jgi:hypothetical protein
MFRYFYTILIFSLTFLDAFSQSIGEWRMHINYRNSNSAAFGNNRIISATDKSILVYDLEDRSVNPLDKAKGLSDYGVSAVAYDETTNTFIIAYINSNVDLLKGNSLINLPDIKNTLSAGSKTINKIFTYEGLAYLSTDFGIVVIDIENEEVDNTYVIGSTGNQTIVLDCTISRDTIYALTQEGLKKSYLGSGNLLDFNQWNHNFAPITSATDIEIFEDTLYALADGFWQLIDGTWNLIQATNTSVFKNLLSSESLTFISDNLYVLEYASNTIDTVSTNFLIDPSFCLKENGNYFFGDYKFGLFQGNQSISTSTSPYTNRGFRATSFGNTVAITAGGFNLNLDGLGDVEGGFYIFENNNWNNQNIYSGIGQDKPSQDLNRLAYNAFNNKLYIGMFKGLIEYDFNTVKIYNETNSPIDSAIGNGFFKKISGVDIDSEGNTWMLNPQTAAALLVKTLDDTWLEFVTGDDNDKLNNLMIDSYDQKWIALRNQGIIIYKEGENLSSIGSQKITLSSNSNQGNLPNNNVNCMIEDNNQQIWVGTDEGIAVFSCPNNIFDASSACRISDRLTNTLDDFTEYLFETDAVTAIEIDGANRKWIGTSAGVWLLSADGKDEIQSFNTENSPLPSNTIFDISVNKGTGEVFILTDQGIVSYFSDATEGAENHDEIKAYPNPVRPNYTGFISITGLVQDAFVKITDAHGVLIDEGFALGGKYVWDGNDYNGNRARTGIYYVFSANTDASQKAVTKIAFVK